ncbi:ABC transporter ATP-binding protein [Tannerella forsythia]|uniref:ATP-binding cassette domain-containing protein n=1 Tax=Tannerella forsythia TaxID=28112 RepID=A0A3P1XJF1_TANFO|nr:ABC transporter ATP-binding protein [Tannerella forsythia]RRD56983.1 ATP-binding cassette domain-containing protein [Tannerella forsythia]RRD74327.1 ATP-binding cassette domain-containing protein [Tannerella forsythia]
MYFIEAEHIVKQYANHRALDDVSIRVPEGKIFGLLGPNGAGKTTLIRIINRITAPDSGLVRFDGRPSTHDDIYRIGYLPEERGLYKKMKVGEQAVYFARLKGLSSRDANKRLTEWFEKFDIMPWWNRKLEELSKGMQQKVQFIITVVHEPTLLIFDEPFSGFDPVNADRLKQEMLQLKEEGRTLIFSTHNMPSVEEICDEIALIDRSHVVLSGDIHEVRERFKENIFRVVVAEGQPLTSVPELFTVLSEKAMHGYAETHIRKAEGVANSSLLNALAQQHEIRSFNEVLPSMNDIFIRTVTQNTSQPS